MQFEVKVRKIIDNDKENDRSEYLWAVKRAKRKLFD